MTCTTTEYGSAVSIMGNTSNGHMMAIEKWYAGWFRGCNAVRVRSSGTFTLQPLENPCGGIQALQIPMPVTTRTFDTQQSNNPSPARYYYLEYRNGTGLDTGMTPSVIVVASDDIAAPNRVCARSVQLDMNPSTNPLNGMTAGQTYMDPAGGVSFSVMSLTPQNAVINVTVTTTMPNTCMDGTTLVGSGPATCAGGPGTGGMGGAGGMGGRGGSAGTAGMGGRGGAGGAGTGGMGGGSAGTPMAGAGGAPMAGSGGAPPGGFGGTPITSGTGGMPAGGGAGSSTGGSAGLTGATGGSAGMAGGTIAGAAGSVSTGGTAPNVVAPDTAADDGGCGCRIAGSSSERPLKSFASLAVLGLLALRRRRTSSRRN